MFHAKNWIVTSSSFTLVKTSLLPAQVLSWVQVLEQKAPCLVVFSTFIIHLRYSSYIAVLASLYTSSKVLQALTGICQILLGPAKAVATLSCLCPHARCPCWRDRPMLTRTPVTAWGSNVNKSQHTPVECYELCTTEVKQDIFVPLSDLYLQKQSLPSQDRKTTDMLFCHPS